MRPPQSPVRRHLLTQRGRSSLSVHKLCQQQSGKPPRPNPQHAYPQGWRLAALWCIVVEAFPRSLPLPLRFQASLKNGPAHIVPLAQPWQDIPLVCLCGNHDVGNRPNAVTIEEYKREFGDDYLAFWAGGCRCIVVNTSLYNDPSDAEKEVVAHACVFCMGFVYHWHRTVQDLAPDCYKFGGVYHWCEVVRDRCGVGMRLIAGGAAPWRDSGA